MWIYRNLFGKCGLVCGVLALVFVLAVKAAPELNDGRPGIVNYLVSNVVSAFSAAAPAPNEPTLSSTGVFPLSEKHEKNVLIYAALSLCVLCLGFVLLAEKYAEFTLYSATGAFAAFSALGVWKPAFVVLFAIPAFLGAWYFRRQRVKPNNGVDSAREPTGALRGGDNDRASHP